MDGFVTSAPSVQVSPGNRPGDPVIRLVLNRTVVLFAIVLIALALQARTG